MDDFNKVFITAFIILSFGVAISAQDQESKPAPAKSDSIYFESAALFECNLQFPGDYNPDKPYALVIGLHGGGASYETFKNIWQHFENPQFILATPQAPYKWLIEEKIGYDWSAWPTGNLEAMANALKLTPRYIENLIKILAAKYNVGEVYLMGFSQGAIISQIAGIYNHELLKGVIILSGPPLYEPGWSPWAGTFEIGWPSKEEVRAANHMKVFIAHGKSDAIINIELAYKSRDNYKGFGYDVRFLEFDGGHAINDEAMKAIEKWLADEN